MKILITGAAGYIGSVLCEMACRDHEIIAVDKGMSGCRSLLGLPIRFYNLDIVRQSDQEQLKKLCEEADVIIHLAALVGVPLCNKDPNLSYLSNMATASIIGAHNKRTIFSSTTSVYGKVEGVCTELSKVHPLSIYGEHKAGAEALVGDEATIFRFATAFGVSRSLRLNLLPNELVYRALRDKALLVYEKDAMRSFIHVKDMAKILLTAATTNRFANEIYNVGTINCSKGELAEKIKSLTGCDVIYKDWMKDPEKRDYQIDYSKLLSVYNEPFTTLDDGLIELVNQMPMILCEETFL